MKKPQRKAGALLRVVAHARLSLAPLHASKLVNGLSAAKP
jgi:hypothetical protein